MYLCSSLFWHFYWIEFVTISFFVGSDLISPNNMLICHFLMRWNKTEHEVLKWSCNSIWWRGSKWGEVMEFMGNEVIEFGKSGKTCTMDVVLLCLAESVRLKEAGAWVRSGDFLQLDSLNLSAGLELWNSVYSLCKIQLPIQVVKLNFCFRRY